MPRRDGNREASGAAGYTLIELALVITILGILAGVAAPRFFDQSTFANRGYADTIAGAYQAAQKIAVASGCPVQLTIDANGYRAFQQAASGNTCNTSDTSWSTPAQLPSGEALAGPAQASASPLPVTVTFQGSGGLAGAAPATLSIGSWRVAVDATTGYVTIGGGG